MPPSNDSFRESIKRCAIVMEIGGFRPDENPKPSWFGYVTLGLPGEKWPRTADDDLMWPLAQVNVAELPFRPQHLADVELFTAFVNPDKLGEEEDQPNGSAWCLRAYHSLSALVPLEIPPGLQSGTKALRMRSTIVEEDYPVYDDLPDGIPEEIGDSYHDDFENVSGFKLGGWPTLIQSEITWAPNNEHPAKPEYVFQIDSTEKGRWSWGDGGVGYFGRGTAPGHENEWVLEWQCY